MVGLGIGTVHAVVREGVSLVNPTIVIVGTYLASPIGGFIAGKILGTCMDIVARKRNSTKKH